MGSKDKGMVCVEAHKAEAQRLKDAAETLVEAGETHQAVDHLRRAVTLDPDLSLAHWDLAEALHRLGDMEAALAAYQCYLDLDPDDPEAAHMVAALGGALAPARVPDAFLVMHFDRFADSFDASLRGELDYRAPEILHTALMAALDSRADGRKDGFDILDLGCGTGLCAPLLRPLARRLDGIDLSSGMIEKARQSARYDRLITGELEAEMDNLDNAYDILIAADVLVYFGNLGPLLQRVRARLRPGGLFAFTLEEGDHEAARLTVSGRYAHGRGHIANRAQEARLQVASMERAVLRTEYGEPVEGLAVVLTRP